MPAQFRHRKIALLIETQEGWSLPQSKHLELSLLEMFIIVEISFLHSVEERELE
jgi:hypothetical protein